LLREFLRAATLRNFSTEGQEPGPITISEKALWSRLEQLVEIASEAQEYKAALAPTQWEGFLSEEPGSEGGSGQHLEGVV